MPIRGYSVLTGRAIDLRRGSGHSPHYQVEISDETDLYRLAINVESQDGSEVLYVVVPHFDHPILAQLGDLQPGLQPVPSRPGGIALDYIRGNLLSPSDMVPLPVSTPGPDNDLNEKIGQYVERAMADEAALIHAFGQAWGPEQKKRDQYFGFLPGRGIHDIHMNQGNPRPPTGPASFFHDNGPNQDGGLIFHFPAQQQWVGIFLKFQSQSWHTDDTTGAPLDLQGSGPPSDGPEFQPGIIGRHHVPTVAQPDGLVRIVGALANSVESPEQEFVTLLNTANQTVSLEGWHLADRNKNLMALSGAIEGGHTMRVQVQSPMQLSNRGGIISLLDSRGVKVHGVSYTREQAMTPGRTIAFRG
jgi:uncharacterized protein YukJ